MSPPPYDEGSLFKIDSEYFNKGPPVPGLEGSAKRRDKLYIIGEILEIAREGSLKTQIMYRGNLSFTQLNDYLQFLLKINLLEEVPMDNRYGYKATKKGLDFLQKYSEIIELIKSDESKGNDIMISAGMNRKSRTTLLKRQS